MVTAAMIPGADKRMRPTETASTSGDVRSLIDASGFTWFQGRIFALCFCIVLLDGFDTAAIGYIAPSLSTEWGIPRSGLGSVLTAALFGLTFGALAAGPLADRFGRKTVLVAAVAEFGFASVAASLAPGLAELVVLRFLTGLGLGAAMPNAVTLTSEYSPAARRALLTNLMFCGFPLGAAAGGFLAAWLIPEFGWRSVLSLGGVAPLILAALLVPALPESLSFLVATGGSAKRVRAVLSRIAPEAATIDRWTSGNTIEHRKPEIGSGIVLSPAYRIGSVMLWLAYFMGLAIFYALVNWMPILFQDAGMEPRSAARVAALFPLGGVGAILLGALMDRFNPDHIVALTFAATAVAVFLVGQAAGHLDRLTAAVFVAGILMNTAQSSLPALAAEFYPTRGRATGVACMLGIGRFGGIAGSFLVADLTSRGLSLPSILTIVAMPALIAALALVVKPANRRQTVDSSS